MQDLNIYIMLILFFQVTLISGLAINSGSLSLIDCFEEDKFPSDRGSEVPILFGQLIEKKKNVSFRCWFICHFEIIFSL